MAAASPKLLLVLSHDYGELFNAIYLVAGTRLSASFVLPPKLYQANRGSLGYPATRYERADDIAAAAERERPDLIVLLSAYLFVINKLLDEAALERLINAWRAEGIPIATTDPALGLMSRVDESTFSPRHPGRAVLARHFRWLSPLLHDAFHLYLAPDGIVQAAPHGSFYNRRHVLSSEDRQRNGANVPVRLQGVAARRWLFILSPEDFSLQSTRLGVTQFAAVLAARLQDAIDSGRQPVLIAPPACLTAVQQAAGAPRNLLALSATSYAEFMSLLNGAEYVFYWNMFSASMLARVLNRLPIFTFDAGHLVHALPSILETGKSHFYLGGEPTRLDVMKPLADASLQELAASQQTTFLTPVSDYLASSPSPEELIARCLQRR